MTHRGSQLDMQGIRHKLNEQISSMLQNHSNDLDCKAIPRIDVMYGGRELTIAGG